MVDALFGILFSFIGWLVSALPSSPFASLVLDVDVFPNSGITGSDLFGWLNWLVPFGDMLLLLNAWLVAALAIVAIKVFLKPSAKAYETSLSLR